MQTADERRSLGDVLAELAPANTPNLYYVRRGDFLTINFSSDEHYETRIDDVLTIFRSTISKDVVGCKIKGVSLLAENVKNMITIEDDQISIKLILLNALGTRSKLQQYYYDVSQKCDALTLRFSELAAA